MCGVQRGNFGGKWERFGARSFGVQKGEIWGHKGKIWGEMAEIWGEIWGCRDPAVSLWEDGGRGGSFSPIGPNPNGPPDWGVGGASYRPICSHSSPPLGFNEALGLAWGGGGEE